MNKAIIGLGSNINPEINIRSALEMMAGKVSIIRESSLLKTKPLGYAQQADFVNSAILIQTEMTPESLESWLKEIEYSLGRIRTENKNGPRTIDLDILVYEGKILDSDVFKRDYLQQNILAVAPELEPKFI